MKKLILILLFIPLVFSCSSVSKKEPNPFSPGDKWVEFGVSVSDSNYYEWKVDWDNLSFERYIEFTNNSKILRGTFRDNDDVFTYKRVNPYARVNDGSLEDKFKDDLVSDKLSENRDTIIIEFYSENAGRQIRETLKPIFYSNDTLALEYYEPNNDGYKNKVFYKLYPKYQPDEARAILMSTKSDLDLEIITQKQYDSVKEIMSRYINWKN